MAPSKRAKAAVGRRGPFALSGGALNPDVLELIQGVGAPKHAAPAPAPTAAPAPAPAPWQPPIKAPPTPPPTMETPLPLPTDKLLVMLSGHASQRLAQDGGSYNYQELRMFYGGDVDVE